MRKPVSEADVQFELYRHLKNLISSQPEWQGMLFHGVVPEQVVVWKAADLVIHVQKGDSTIPIAVLEVKKPTDHGVLVYDPKAVEQVLGYARNLALLSHVDAILSILTDGSYLRVFGPTGEALGEYEFKCDANSCKVLLSNIPLLANGQTNSLPFKKAHQESLEDLSVEADQVLPPLLRELIDYMSRSSKFKSEPKKNDGRNLRFDGYLILSLDLNQDPALNTFVLWLDGLREVVQSNLSEVILQLSDSSGFAWIKSRKVEGKYMARSLRQIAAEEGQQSSIRDALRDWLGKLMTLHVTK